MHVQRLPHSVEAERSVISALITQPESYHDIADLVDSPDIFYFQGNRMLFQAIATMHSEGKQIDFALVTEYLMNTDADGKRPEKGKLIETVGGVSYISGLIDDFVTASNIRAYVQVLNEKAILRRTINALTDGLNICQSGGDVDENINKIQQLIFTATEKSTRTQARELSTYIPEMLKRIRIAHESKKIQGMPTGLTDLDEILCGLFTTEFTVVAGRPGMGKTTFGLNLARNLAKQGFPGIIYELEMSGIALTTKIVTSEAGVNSEGIRSGKISGEDVKAMTNICADLQDLPIEINDTPGLRLIDIASESRRLKAERGIKWIVIDYLQLMKPMVREQSRDREVAEISAGLKGICKDLDISVIALSQLNRMVENRTDKRPQLADLRDSGAIEQDADNVIFIYRDEHYNRPENWNENVAELKVAKQREGRQGVAYVVFRKETSNFKDIDGLSKRNYIDKIIQGKGR